ncbi:Potassium-transporting ATPase alpha chain 2 [Balamuthia mandrillaris]
MQQQHTGKDRSTADRLKGDGGNNSGGTNNNNNALLSLKGRLASRKERKQQQQQAAANSAAAGEPQTQTQQVADGSPPLSSSCSPPSQVGNSSSQRSGGGKKSPKTRKAKTTLKRAQTLPVSSSASVSTPSVHGQEQNLALASATKDEEQATLPEQEQPATAPPRPPAASKFAATLEELQVRGLDWNTASSSSAKRVAQRLETDLQGGLSKQEALRRLKTYGPNKFLPPKSKKKRKEMGFQGKQEPLRPTTVIRGGERLQVPPESLVVGDLVEVVRGERIPADFRITHCSKDFCVDMHHLTGVKSPQFRSEKVHEAPWEANEVFAARNLALTSSTVCEGEAAGIVIATGNTTEFAQMVQGLLQVPRRRNNMDKTEKASKAVLKTLTRKWIFPKDPVAVAQLAYTDALVLDTEGLLTVGHPHASHVVVDVQLYSCTACGLDPFSNKSYAALLRAFALCTNASFLTSTSAFIPPLVTSSLDDASGLDGDSQGISDSPVDGAPLPSPRAVASSPPTGGFSSPPPSPRSPRPTHKAAGRDSSSLGISQQQGAASASLSSSPTFSSPLQSNQIVAASKKLRVKELFSRKDKSAAGSLASTSPPTGVGATASEQASTNLVRSEYGSDSSNMPSTSPTATSFGTSPPFLLDITAEGLPISSRYYSLESLATLPIVGDKWDAAFLYFYEHAMVPPNVLRNYPAYEEARFEWPRVHAQAFESPIPWAVSVHRWRSKNKSEASLQKDSDTGAPKEKFSARAIRKRSQSLEERPPPAPPKKGGRRGTNERKKGKKRAGSDSETPVEASAREYSSYEHQEAEMQEQMLAERSFYYQRERINSEHPLPLADDEQINDPLEASTDHARTEEETSSLEDGDLPSSVGRSSSSSSSSSSKASSRRRRQRPTTGSSKRSTRYYDHRDRRQREKMAVPPSAATSTKGRAQSYSNPQRTFLVLLRGMPEVVFSKCNSFMLNGKRKKLSSRDLHTKMIIYQYLRTQGERVIAFAQKVLRDDKYPPDYEFGLDDFQGKFTLLGLASCIDRPYDNITHIVRKYQEAQIKLFMCTPLHPLPAKVLASACGIITAEQAVDGFFTKDGHPIPFISTATAQESTATAGSLSSSADVEQRAAVVSGSALKDMTDETLQTILQQYEQVIFASMPVGLKFKIVGALQTLGYVVSVTGESVSEAAALKLADIGISFRRKGTAIAKNNADVILLKDDNGLPLLLNAIEIVKASRKKKKRSRDKVSSAAGAP